MTPISRIAVRSLLATALIFSVSIGCAKKVTTTEMKKEPVTEKPAEAPVQPPLQPPEVREEIISPPVPPPAPEPALSDIFFDFDRATIRPDDRASLEANARVLAARSDVKIRIEGHCDERGSIDYNLVLGEKRARATKDFLAALGVNPNRISIISFGKEKPFCFDRDEDCYQKNRRSHFVLSP